MANNSNELNPNIKGNNEYIAGLVQADGSFGVKITLRKKYIQLEPVFTLVQHIYNKELILAIKEEFGDIGN